MERELILTARAPAPPPSTAPISAAEQTKAARIGAALFRHRSWLPLLFLGILLIAPATPSEADWIAGGVLIVLGEVFRLAGVAAAGTETRRRSRSVQRLVTYGVFQWSRNPLYNGNFLIWMGFVVLYGVLWFLPIAIVLFAVEYSFIVRYEEGVLESIFGRKYLEYKNRTPRWIPRSRFSSAGSRSESYHWGQAWRSEISTFLQYAVLVGALVIKGRYFSR